MFDLRPITRPGQDHMLFPTSAVFSSQAAGATGGAVVALSVAESVRGRVSPPICGGMLGLCRPASFEDLREEDRRSHGMRPPTSRMHALRKVGPSAGRSRMEEGALLPCDSGAAGQSPGPRDRECVGEGPSKAGGGKYGMFRHDPIAPFAVRVSPLESWFWSAAILDGRSGAMEPAFGLEADMEAPGWDDQGRLVTSGLFFRSSLWRFRPAK